MSEPVSHLVQLAFGIVYNEAIRRGLLRDMVSIQVVFGVLGVLVIASHVSPASTGWLLLAGVQLSNAQHAVVFIFQQLAFAGLPMVLGSLWRWYSRQ